MVDIFPQDEPDHHAIGNYFIGHGKDFVGKSEIYFCDSYDPQQGYWMTSLSDETNRKNVSEMAIGRTIHKIHDDGYPSGILHSQWGRVDEADAELIRAHVESMGMTPSGLRR